MKYRVLFRPYSDCLGIYKCDNYGHAERLEGTFCINGEKQRFFATVDLADTVGSFAPNHLDPLEENQIDTDMDFPSDEAALAFVDWFDGSGFDPWRVDFIWAYDGSNKADREVYWM